MNDVDDDAFIQEITSEKDYAGSQIRKSVIEECTREEEIIVEKRSDVKADCQVKNTMSIDKNEDQTKETNKLIIKISILL